MTRLPVTWNLPLRRGLGSLVSAGMTAAMAAACSGPLAASVRDLETGSPSPTGTTETSTPSSSAWSSSSSSRSPRQKWVATTCALSEATLRASYPGDWTIKGPNEKGLCTYVNREEVQLVSTSIDDKGNPNASIAGLLVICLDAQRLPSVDPDAYACMLTVNKVRVLTGVVKRPSHIVLVQTVTAGKSPTAKELATMTGWLKAAR